MSYDMSWIDDPGLEEAIMGTIKRPKPISAEAKSKAWRIVEQQLKVLRGKRLIREPKRFAEQLRVHIKRTQVSRGGLGRGWRPYITIAAHRYQATGAFCEYSHIQRDPEIGGFRTDEPDRIFKTVIAHELAHAVVIWNWSRKDRRSKPPVAHGHEWRTTYRELRRSLA